MKTMLFSFFMLCIAYSGGVYATDLTSRWELNINQHIGYLDLSVNGTQVNGSVRFNIDANGKPINQSFRLINGHFSQNSQEMRLEFTRQGGEAQKYVGWVSPDGKIIAGYFGFGTKKRPWFAKKVGG